MSKTSSRLKATKGILTCRVTQRVNAIETMDRRVVCVGHSSARIYGVTLIIFYTRS
jgi:hypothetical protein